jgi:hypothetical protein
MPAEISKQDAATAQMVLELCRLGESRDKVDSTTFEVPLPANANPSDDPAGWMSWVYALPDIAGRPSLSVQVTIEGARPLKVDTADDGQRILRCTGDGSSAIVLRSHDFT